MTSMIELEANFGGINNINYNITKGQNNMTIKCKYSDIKEIYDWYKRFADEKLASYYDLQPNIHQTAYYTPSQANWSYCLGVVMLDGQVYDVVTVFGSIKALRPANLFNYNSKELKAIYK